MHTIKFSIVCLCMIGILYAGWLIKAPFKTEYPQVVADFSEKMDLNSDGIVQKNEFEQIAPGTFAFETIDLNNNQELDFYEVERLIVNVSPQMVTKNRLPRVQ